MNTKTKVDDSEQAEEIVEKESLELVPVGEESKSMQTAGLEINPNDPPMLQMINRMSQLPDFDMERVKEFYSMHKEMEAERKETEFNDAMAKAQNEIQSIVTNQYNKHTESGFANLSALHESAKPVWTSHGFSVVAKTKPSDKEAHIYVITEVRHSGGHKEIYSDYWPIDDAGTQGTKNKTPIQAKGSSMAYARRYTELAIFDVAVIHEDNDGNSGKARQELSQAAGDWIAKINECSNLADLEKAFTEAFAALKGDGFGRNQVIKAKDATKAKIEGRS